MTAIRVAALVMAALVWATPATSESLRHRPHCQEGLFCLSAERVDDQVLLWLDVETDKTLTLAVELDARNLEGPTKPIRRVLAGGGRQRLASLRVSEAGDWSLAWRYSFHPGQKRANHAPDTLYRLPYRPGETYRVIQGAEGPLSHRGPLTNAIDWAMPVGTPVLAARGGEVVGLRDGAGSGGPDAALSGQENFVWIRHEDGTVGHYLHLQAGSLAVTEGQKVSPGDVIARSGNSGFSTEPHLHFHVGTPTENGVSAFESFPLHFVLDDGITGSLDTGSAYRAPEP